MARTKQIHSSKPRICSYCECTGHNRATCMFRIFSTSFGDLDTSEPQEIRTCSYCGCGGHDLRNCLAYEQLKKLQFVIEEDSSSTNSPTTPPFYTPRKSSDLSHISKRLIFETPPRTSALCSSLDLSTEYPDLPKLSVSTPQKSPRRSPRIPLDTNVALKSVQMIDPDIYDEPWIWCPPISGETRPKFNRVPNPNPPLHTIIIL